MDPYVQALLSYFTQRGQQDAQQQANGIGGLGAPMAAPAATDAPGGLLGDMTGAATKNPNAWSPDNAQDIMWLRQNNPGQLQALSQQEMVQPGYDPAKAKWGTYSGAMGQAMYDRDAAGLTGLFHGQGK